MSSKSYRIMVVQAESPEDAHHVAKFAVAVRGAGELVSESVTETTQLAL